MRILAGPVALLLTFAVPAAHADDVHLASMSPDATFTPKVKRDSLKTGWNYLTAPRCRQTANELSEEGRACTFQCRATTVVIELPAVELCPASLQIDL